MNRPDTQTIGENLTAVEQHGESAAFRSLKSCFGGLKGTRQPRESVWWPQGINRGRSIRYTAPTQNRSAAAANCSWLCSHLVQQSVANVIRSLRTKAAFGKQRLFDVNAPSSPLEAAPSRMHQTQMMGTIQSNILDSRLLNETRTSLHLPQMHQSVHVQRHFSKNCLCHRCKNPLVAFFFFFCTSPRGSWEKTAMVVSVPLHAHAQCVPVHVTASAVNLGHRIRTDAGQQRPLFSVCAFHLVVPKCRSYGYT